jgi:hypothetical protein
MEEALLANKQEVADFLAPLSILEDDKVYYNPVSVEKELERVEEERLEEEKMEEEKTEETKAEPQEEEEEP